MVEAQDQDHTAHDDRTAATRQDILSRAKELFEHYGFNKTTIGDIAKCCQMSPGNLYRFFRNKQAIGLASVEEYFRSAEVMMAAELMPPSGASEDRIRRFLEAGVRHISEEMERAPKIVELAEFLMEDDDGWAVLQAHIIWKRNRVMGELETGIASGEFAQCDVEHTARTMLNGLKVFWMPITLIRWRDRSTILPEFHDQLDLMFRGIRAR